MEDIIVIFLLVSFLLAFLAAAILIWVNKDQQHSNRFLGMLLIILALTNLNDVFLYKAWFLQFPYLHKLILPNKFKMNLSWNPNFTYHINVFRLGATIFL
jgi:hypothetical protein